VPSDLLPDAPGPEPIRPAELSPKFLPTEADVNGLIASASQRPGGLEFLLQGHLGTVAITFGCHAFVVAAARDRLLTPDSRDRSS
jgi:hypothetical protein